MPKNKKVCRDCGKEYIEKEGFYIDASKRYYPQPCKKCKKEKKKTLGKGDHGGVALGVNISSEVGHVETFRVAVNNKNEIGVPLPPEQFLPSLSA